MNKVQQLIDFLGHYPRIDGRMADGKVKGYFKDYAQAAFQQLAAALDTPSGNVGFRNVHETHSGEVYLKFMVSEHRGIAVTLTWNGAHTKVAIRTIASLRETWGGPAVLAPLTDLLAPMAMHAHFDTLHHTMPPKPSESDAPPMPMDAVRISPQGKVGWVTQAEGLPGKRALSVRVESTLYRVHEHNATVLLPANQVQHALRTDLHELTTLSYERWLTLPAWTVAHNHLTRWLDGMAASPFLGKALYHRWMYQHQAVVDLATKCILVRQPLADEALEAAHRISDFLADGSAEQKKVGRLLRHVQFRLQPDLPEPVLGDPPFRHGDQVTYYTLSGIVVDVLPTMYDQGAKWGWEFFVFGTERYASKRVNPEVMRNTTLDTRDRYITINPHWTTLNQLHDFYFIPSKWHEAAIASALEELGFQYERDPMGDFLVKGINPNLMYRMRQATKQYGLRPLPLTRQDHGPLPQSPKDNMPMSDPIAYTKPAFKFSAVTEVPRDKITLRPDLFQGRQHDFAKETVDKIVREGFDKSREPIIVWKDAQGRYVVISGHSRWEASERLFEAGDTGLKTMPVKFFQGTLQDAIDFAVLESNRDGTQEGLKSDLQAYRRAVRQGRNRDFLQGIFKPENRLRLLEDIVSLDEDGTWMRYLDTSAEKHFPYLQRNAAWVGQLRKQLPELTHRHEHELFEYLYAIKDGKTTGKQRLLITKDQLFTLVEKRVARTDFTPERPLNLAALPSTSAVTEPQRERLAEIQAEIDRLARERAEKDDLIATATASQEFELVGKFKRRQSAINALITEKKLEIATLQQAIGKLEANTIDLFTAPDTSPPTDEFEALESMLASLGETADEAPSDSADEADEGMAALDALIAELDVEAPPANRSDADGEAAPGESAKRPPAGSQDLLHLLTDGHYFAQRPENVLGELYDFKNPWGQLEKRVRMTGDGGAAQFDHLKRFLPAPSDPPAAPSASEPEALNPTERLRVEKVLTQAVKAEQADQEKVILGVNREACPEGSHCFEDVLAKFNEGISEDEIKAWVWHQRNTGGINETWLPEDSGWRQYFTDQEDINDHLERWLAQDIVCFDRGNYVPAILYYSGHVYERLRQLELSKDALMQAHGEAQYARQKAGLENAKPTMLLLRGEQDTRLYIYPRSEFARGFAVTELADGTLFQKPDPQDRDAFVPNPHSLLAAFQHWLTDLPDHQFDAMTAAEINKYFVRMKSPPMRFSKPERDRLKRRAKIEGQRFFERFLVEGLTTADQERLELAWNSRYNGFVPTNYFKVPMAFRVSSTFKNEPLFIRPAQREGVGFIAANGKGCLAFGTGVGKTVSAILTIAHKLESGRCRRPLIVVPNGVYGQWMAELQGKYVDEQLVQTGLLPHVPINDFYNLRGDYGTQVMDAEGQVDPVPVGTITLLTYEGFNQLTLSARERKAYQYEFFDVLNQGTESYREEEKLQAKAEALVGRGLEGGTFPIDKLGFDCIVFDEAHNIKKVFTRVRGDVNEEGRRMARDFKIESGSPSMIALRAFMLFYYVLQQNDNRNIVLLTATPFTNSPLEYFSFLALMAFEELKAAKMSNLRAFFEQFVNTSLELTVDHTLKAVRKETIMGMSNVRGLQNWIFRFILHKTELDGEANRPKKYVLPLLQQEVDGQLIDLPKSDQINTSLQPSAVQQAILEKLELYARGIINLEDLALDKERMKDLGIDVPDDEDGDEVAEEDMDEEDKDTARTLRAITLSNLVTLSPYLYPGFDAPEPTAKEFVHASPKISYAMQCIASVLNFCSLHDVRVPGQIIYMNAGKKYFPLLREYLIDYIGLGQHEVATISGGNSKKKQSVQDRFLAGKVKVLIGTSAIVEGMNLQTWTTDIYNLWIGWNPAEMHQLTGRGWRPGNRYAHFRHTIPMLENSLDSFKWQKNQEKTSRINQIWRTDEDSNVMSLEDLNPAELKLALITDPFAMAELLLLEEKETIMDSVASLKNQIEVIRELEAAQQEFDRHYDTIKRTVDRVRPPADGNPNRSTDRILSLYRKVMDESLAYVSRSQRKNYIKVRKAWRTIVYGEQKILGPRGLDLSTDLAKVIEGLEGEVAEQEHLLETRTGQEAVDQKADEIMAERAAKGRKPATIAERVTEFTKLNRKVLTAYLAEDVSEKVPGVDDAPASSKDGPEAEDLEMAHLEALMADLETLDAMLQELTDMDIAA